MPTYMYVCIIHTYYMHKLNLLLWRLCERHIVVAHTVNKALYIITAGVFTCMHAHAVCI